MIKWLWSRNERQEHETAARAREVADHLRALCADERTMTTLRSRVSGMPERREIDEPVKRDRRRQA